MDVEDDIQFDFFEDEGATAEATPASRVRLRRPAGPRRKLGRPRGVGPLVRLLLLVAFVVFLVVVFGLLIQSCSSASKHDAYAHYMDDVGKLATQSSANGKSLSTVLTTPGLSVAQIETRDTLNRPTGGEVPIRTTRRARPNVPILPPRNSELPRPCSPLAEAAI